MKSGKNKNIFPKCRICKIQLTSENSKEYNIKYSKYICDPCLKVKNEIKYLNNKEHINKIQKITEHNRKIKVMENYGGKCVCCGECAIEFLTIDHINDDGSQIRKETKQGTGGKLYRWLIKNNFPKDNYQILCYNCNCAKGFFGYCPHNKKI